MKDEKIDRNNGKRTTLFSRENQPSKKAGKSFKTKLLDAVRAESLIGSRPSDSLETAETLYITHMAKRAFDVDDQASATLSKELLSKSYASLKSTMPEIQFDFDPDSKPSDQASQILKAAADGLMPPDVAQIFISSIASMMKIEEVTELAKRLEAIEKQLGVN